MKGTMRKQSLRLSRRGFNPRTHVGYDYFAKNTHLLYIFNPRTHEGYDGNQYYYLSRLSCFNPRTHVGYDWREF